MAAKPVPINGVIVEPLRQIVDHRGAVLHMLRCDAPFFKRFGEVYFSLILPRAIKAWKRHRLVTQHFAVPVGQIRLVLYDDRASSPTHAQIAEYDLGRPDHYCLVRIPPMIWYGFQGLAAVASLVANCTDLPHNPQETESLPMHSPHIPYSWVVQNV
jgi:dTDP-4-dehydrorhamnose 3,5-epimerase